MTSEKVVQNILSAFTFNNRVFDLLGSGHITAFNVKSFKINCVINVTNENQAYINKLAKLLEKTLRALPSITDVNFVFTGKKLEEKLTIPNVKNIVLVSSGKGGVGKSTVAFLTALKLAESGLKIGLVDADIYGPSLPTLTGISMKPEIEDNHMIPHLFKNVQMNSIGYLVPEGKALIWRGPMVTKALHQLLYGTKWKQLDYLIVDMPPGTGDIHLTIAEKYKVSSVVLVSTPQSLTLADLARAVDMYKTLELNILGVVENMTYFKNRDGKEHALYAPTTALADFCNTNKLEIIEKIPFCQTLDDLKLYFNKLSSRLTAHEV